MKWWLWVFIFPQLCWGLADLNFGDPPTAYLQWLSSPSDVMTEANGSSSVAIDPYVGGAVSQLSQPPDQVLYLGVMCNRRDGYHVYFTAQNSGATASTAKMTLPGGSDLTYTVSVSTEAATFSSGAFPSSNVNLTGATPTASCNFQNNSHVPRKTDERNVWRVTVQLPVIASVSDGLIMEGTYSGGFTATATMQ